MLCEHGNIAPCVECDVEPLKAENEALRAQLKEAEEKGRVLMDMCRFWKARVAQMHEAAHELYAWCVENLTAEQIKEGLPAGHKIGQLLEFERPAVEAFILRKQAEAVGSLRFPTMMRKMWSGGEVQGWLDDQAKLFSDEADEAERAANAVLTDRVEELETMVKVFRGCIETGLMPELMSPCYQKIVSLVGRNAEDQKERDGD